MVEYNKLNNAFYTRADVVQISKDLIGKYLLTYIDGVETGGMIVETEAYSGRNDKACHANLNRRTQRTRVMYEEGGVAYVYLCYGIHYLFNIITNEAESADAVLVRAIEPVIGIEYMQNRRKLATVAPRLTAGPGLVSQALGINRKHYGVSLSGNSIWLEDRNIIVSNNDIIASARVGVSYAEDDALLPWRFRLKNNQWVSKAK